MSFITPYIGWGTTALEVVVGIIFIAHGWSNALNPAAAGKVFKKGKKAGLLYGIIEFMAGVMIASGIGTFTGTVIVSAIALGALYNKIFKRTMPFKTDTTGWEYDLLILAAALSLLLG